MRAVHTRGPKNKGVDLLVLAPVLTPQVNLPPVVRHIGHEEIQLRWEFGTEDYVVFKDEDRFCARLPGTMDRVQVTGIASPGPTPCFPERRHADRVTLERFNDHQPLKPRSVNPCHGIAPPVREGDEQDQLEVLFSHFPARL